MSLSSATYEDEALVPLPSLCCAGHLRAPLATTSPSKQLSNSGGMEPHLIEPSSLCWSSSIPLTHTSRSLKVLIGTTPTSNRQLFIRAGKRNSGSSDHGLQKQPNKDLSRILRTEAAISAIERKAKSEKYNNLWPKAVLEALDEAIRDNRYESALKVCGFFFL